MLARDLDQAVGVRRVARADRQREVALAGHLLDGRLPVGGGVTDVVGAGADDLREALAQAVDDRPCLVDRQRGLRDVGDLARILHLELVDVALVLDQHDVVGRLAHRAFDLLVAGVPDEHDRVALGGELLGLDVDLGHQRARRVDRVQLRARRRWRARSERRRARRTRPWRPRAPRSRTPRTPRRARAAARPRACCGRSPCARRPARRKAPARARPSVPPCRRPRSSRGAPRAAVSPGQLPMTCTSVGGPAPGVGPGPPSR